MNPAPNDESVNQANDKSTQQSHPTLRYGYHLTLIDS